MNKIKVMHYIYDLGTGGAETLVKNYMLLFDKKKFDTVLLCMKHRQGTPYEKELADNNIRVIYVEDYLIPNHNKNIIVRFINHYLQFVIVRKIIRRNKPDILHTHLTLNVFVKFARPSRGTNIIYTVHNEPGRLWTRGIRTRYRDLGAVEWLVRYRGMRFITLHKAMNQEVNELFHVNNSFVLNNGIDVSKIKMAKDKKLSRDNLKIDRDAFVVGHVGRIAPQKNQVFLVDVFNEIKEQRKNAFLLMIGEGPDKDLIEKKLEGLGLNDSYLILSNRNDISDLMMAMDAFVFPSTYEGLGMALVEAQEAKLPCFVSDSIPEHATISNLVVKLSLKEKPSKWADAILNYKKPSKIVLMDEEWDIKKITKKLENFYLDVLAEKQNGKK